MDFLNRKAIKAEARAFIRPDRKWFSIFLAILPYVIVTNMFTVAYSVKAGADFSDGNYYQVQGSSWSFIGNIIKLIAIPFGIAAAGYMLNHIRGFNPEWKSLYVEGKDRFGKYFEVGFITGLITFLWSLLFIIPGIVKGYAYSQVSYIIHDNPNLSTQDVRKISDLMTKGYKGELFVKDLSFILWDILTVITAGIAGIYVLPYVETTKALYYENFKARGLQTGELNEADFLSASQKTAQAYNNNFGNAQQPYQAPVQPPMGQPYQAPAQPQYQPPTEQPYQAPAQPFNAPVQEAPIEQPLEAPAEESFYTPPADTQQYFNPENTDNNQQ